MNVTDPLKAPLPFFCTRNTAIKVVWLVNWFTIDPLYVPAMYRPGGVGVAVAVTVGACFAVWVGSRVFALLGWPLDR